MSILKKYLSRLPKVKALFPEWLISHQLDWTGLLMHYASYVQDSKTDHFNVEAGNDSAYFNTINSVLTKCFESGLISLIIIII